MRSSIPRRDRGEVDIMQPSEGYVAGSIPAGRTSPGAVMAAGLGRESVFRVLSAMALRVGCRALQPLSAS